LVVGMSASLEPTPEQLEALAARPADSPVVMINLLQFGADGGRTVRYARASPSVVIDMVSNEKYLKVHEHRAAGLDRGDLIATSVWTMAE
jgi:hypothetical protein